jgi:hypothetical protein
MSKKYGYHIKDIKKGKIGTADKVREELLEFEDALEQKSKIMAQVELADVYGALESLAEENGLTMKDLKIFSDITKRAFNNGFR